MGYKSGQCYCISLYIYFEYHWVGFNQNHSPSSKSAKRIRLTAKEEKTLRTTLLHRWCWVVDGRQRKKQRCQKTLRALLQSCYSLAYFCSPQCQCCCWEEEPLEHRLDELLDELLEELLDHQLVPGQHTAALVFESEPGTGDGTCLATPSGPWMCVLVTRSCWQGYHFSGEI